MRSPCTHEHSTALCGIGAATSQIRCQCLADIRRQRKAFDALTFASHHEFTRAPVYVVKIKYTYLSGTQAQTREQHQHSEIALAVVGAPIASR